MRPRWLTGSDESPAWLTQPRPCPMEVEGAVEGLEEEHDLIPGSGSTDLHTIYILFEEAAFWNPSARSSQWHHGRHFRGKRTQRERPGRRRPPSTARFSRRKIKSSALDRKSSEQMKGIPRRSHHPRLRMICSVLEGVKRSKTRWCWDSGCYLGSHVCYMHVRTHPTQTGESKLVWHTDFSQFHELKNKIKGT